MGSDAQTQAPVTPETQPMTPPPKTGGKGMLIAVAVVVIVVIAAVFGYMMFMGGDIEGEWKWDSIKIYNADGTINQEMTDLSNENMPDITIKFNSDGTATSSDSEGNATWKTDGGKLTITTTYSTPVYNMTTGNFSHYEDETDSIVFDYKVSGSTLTLEYEEMGMKFKITAKRV